MANMIDMERKESKSHRIGGNSLPEIADGLRSAAPRIAKVVDRPGRKLEEGPILSRLAAWFLVQEPDVQERIVREGQYIVDRLAADEYVGERLDDEFAARIRANNSEVLVAFLHPPRRNSGELHDLRDLLAKASRRATLVQKLRSLLLKEKDAEELLPIHIGEGFLAEAEDDESVDPVPAPEDEPASAYNPVIASTARKRTLPEPNAKRAKRPK